MPSINEKMIEDVLVIDDTKIPIQFCIQNWDLPFDPELLKKAVKIVVTSENLNISTVDMIDVSLELVKYSADQSPSGMKDIEGEVQSEDSQIKTVVMSDRFTYNMENIVIKVVFKKQELKCFAITSLLSIGIEDYMPLNHVEYSRL